MTNMKDDRGSLVSARTSTRLTSGTFRSKITGSEGLLFQTREGWQVYEAVTRVKKAETSLEMNRSGSLGTRETRESILKPNLKILIDALKVLRTEIELAVHSPNSYEIQAAREGLRLLEKYQSGIDFVEVDRPRELRVVARPVAKPPARPKMVRVDLETDASKPAAPEPRAQKPSQSPKVPKPQHPTVGVSAAPTEIRTAESVADLPWAARPIEPAPRTSSTAQPARREPIEDKPERQIEIPGRLDF